MSYKRELLNTHAREQTNPLRGKGWPPADKSNSKQHAEYSGGRGRVVMRPVLPENKNLKPFALELRKRMTLSEVLLWKRLNKKQMLGLDFCRQKQIGNYIIDFFCLKKMLAIEVDGDSHNEKVEYDAERDRYLESLGIKTLRIYDLDVKLHPDSVVYHIEKFIKAMR